MFIPVFICLLLAVFGIGHWLGRRAGHKEGFNEGILFAPLELRRQCLEDGWCHICGHRIAGERKLTHTYPEDRIRKDLY